jgi:hypothetical protein
MRDRGASAGLVRVIAGLLERTLGSSNSRAFLFFLFAQSTARHGIQVQKGLVFGLEGPVRKEEGGSIWVHLEQRFHASSGRELGEKSKKRD